ncbi:hypothetical protein T492DRAFT_1056405, partial [Pavlovales sp. CCMP2436]
LLLARLSALAPIAAQRGNTTNSNLQIISINALARAHPGYSEIRVHYRHTYTPCSTPDDDHGGGAYLTCASRVPLAF